MRRNKLLGIFFATVLTVTTLAGCGSTPAAPAAGGSDSDSGKTTQADIADSDAATASAPGAASGKQTDGKNLPELTTEPMTITLWDISTEDPNKGISEGAVARFMADYPNITVNQVHQQNDNYKQQLVVAMSSGQCPNIYCHWGGGPMAEYYKSGHANDITEMYAKYDHPEFVDAAVAQSTYDGKMLAIPFSGLTGCDIFYNHRRA